MRNSVRYLTVLVAVLALSSALFASPNANSSNCSGVSSTDGTTWGAPVRSLGCPAGTRTPVANAQVAHSTEQVRSAESHGLAYAFGKLMGAIGASIDGATWGFNPPPSK